MDNNKKNEELQSRREFFKSAAKAALPVIGAVVLASMPILKTEAATGCNNAGCYYNCDGSCSGTCSGCRGECYGSCQHHCSRLNAGY